MKDNYQKLVCSILFVVGLISFILHIFVFEKPDGNFGMILGMIETACIFGSATRLCQLSKEFKNGLFKIIKIVFRF